MTLDQNTRKELLRAAFAAQKNSYAPYSKFNVAAAVLMSSGKIYTGVNIENASYPAGICAERCAVSKAVSEGERVIRAVAIIGGPEYTVKDFCPPCGICRQVIREFGDPAETLVILAKNEEEYLEMTLEELLPLSFGPSALNHEL